MPRLRSELVANRLAESRRALAASEDAYRDSRGCATRASLATYLTVLLARAGPVLARRRIVADLEARALSLDVTLVRALGGGFTATADRQSRNPRTGTWMFRHRCRRRSPAARPPPRAKAPAPARVARPRRGGRRDRLLPLLAGSSRRQYRQHRQCLCRRRHRAGDAAGRGAGHRGPRARDRSGPGAATCWCVLDDTDARMALAKAEADLARAAPQGRRPHATGSGSGGAGAARAPPTSGRPTRGSPGADADVAQGADRSSPPPGSSLRPAPSSRRRADHCAQRLRRRRWPSCARPRPRRRRPLGAASRAASEPPGQPGADRRAGRRTTRRSPPPAPRSSRRRVDLSRHRHPRADRRRRRQAARSQVGQQVAAGAPLMTIVPIQRRLCRRQLQGSAAQEGAPGQPVEADLRPLWRRCVFHGRVTGFSGGTGSAFSLIPAQNATGNWIKVVQRLPVRIAPRSRASSRRIRCGSACR